MDAVHTVNMLPGMLSSSLCVGSFGCSQRDPCHPLTCAQNTLALIMKEQVGIVALSMRLVVWCVEKHYMTWCAWVDLHVGPQST